MAGFSMSASPSPDFSFGAGTQKKKTLPIVPEASPQYPPWMASMFAPQQQHSPVDWAALERIARIDARPPDVQGIHNRAYQPGVTNDANPFNNGFFHQGADNLDAEHRQATQGNSAMTQWAKLGAVPGVDPQKLQNVMGQQAFLPSSNPLPQAQTSDPNFGQAHGGISPADHLRLIQQLYGGFGPGNPMLANH